MLDRLSRFKLFRILWSIPVAWLLWTKYNAPRGHDCRMTLYQEWIYALAMSDTIRDGDYISPHDAIIEDSHYWTD